MKKSLLIALVIVLDFFLFMGLAHATPTAWGQPMPEQCTTRFEWKSPNSYPVHVYDAPGCLQPWLENAATFWKGLYNVIQGKANGSGE